MSDSDKLALDNFRKYLRIPSVHPDINYDQCVEFVKEQAAELSLAVQVFSFFPGKPVVVVSWIGSKPNLKSILLNGHMDVVPVFRDKWTYDPFGAELNEEGNIYARGAQDMKCASIQYLEAVRRLKMDNICLERTVHISFVPDEEIGGFEGMGAFVKSEEFKVLNVGFCLDEGVASQGNYYNLFYGEKTRWVLRIHCPGQTGHGSALLDNTAGEKAQRFLSTLYRFREEEGNTIKNNNNLTTGDVTTLNLTMMEGGVLSNVVPSEFVLTFDFRISTDVDIIEFEKLLNEWCREAGEDVWIEFVQKDKHVPPTKIDASNPFWVSFKKVFDDQGADLRPIICPAVTDNRYIRAVGIPGFGFSPMPNTPILVHSHDEYLNKDVFLDGIKMYCQIITSLANPADENPL